MLIEGSWIYALCIAYQKQIMMENKREEASLFHVHLS